MVPFCGHLSTSQLPCCICRPTSLGVLPGDSATPLCQPRHEPLCYIPACTDMVGTATFPACYAMTLTIVRPLRSLCTRERRLKGLLAACGQADATSSSIAMRCTALFYTMGI